MCRLQNSFKFKLSRTHLDDTSSAVWSCVVVVFCVPIAVFWSHWATTRFHRSGSWQNCFPLWVSRLDRRRGRHSTWCTIEIYIYIVRCHQPEAIIVTVAKTLWNTHRQPFLNQRSASDCYDSLFRTPFAFLNMSLQVFSLSPSHC